MGSGNAEIGSISMGTSEASSRAFVISGGIEPYFVNHASTRARSPLASCWSAPWRAPRRRRHVVQIDRVAARSRVPRDDAAFGEEIELYDFGAAMCSANAETHRGKNTRRPRTHNTTRMLSFGRSPRSTTIRTGLNFASCAERFGATARLPCRVGPGLRLRGTAVLSAVARSVHKKMARAITPRTYWKWPAIRR